MKKTEPLELKDMQGLIVRGYGQLLSACFVLIEIENPGLAKPWLGQVVAEITDGLTKSAESSFNLAFTHPGLTKLGLDSMILNGFSQEFQEGMVTQHRQRILGDHDQSAPTTWAWGGPQTKSVDLVLMLYARDPSSLDRLYQTQAGRLTGSGLVEIHKLETHSLAKRKEHFGFHDGISQPTIIGLSRPDTPENMVAAGEFVLGYPNEYGKYPESPLVSAASDPQQLLPPQAEGSSARDFGRNGSYLVFRQLSQDVRGLWQFLDNITRDSYGCRNPDAAIKLAAKMVGRWPSGAPLVGAPEQDVPASGDVENFSYAMDPDGEKCPIAAHTRRTNPRDSLAPNPATSIVVSKRHRILRRGRAYGVPLVEPLEPKLILDTEATTDQEGERGLYFICLNANLSRQFEFVQHTWINNPKFEGLYWEADPLTGDHDCRQKGALGTFTIPRSPVRQRVTNIPRFVRVCGGAYFFLPGLQALRHLASLP